MWYIGSFVTGMAVGYLMWYFTSYSIKRLDRRLSDLSLRVDLVIEAIENLIEPKTEY